MKTAKLGSVSTGTLKAEDLLEAFASELEFLVQEWCSDEGREQRDGYLRLVWEARAVAPQGEEWTERVAELVDDLMDALQAFAPANAYFGAHIGDGADFGFWLYDEADNEECEGELT